jgi:hypothetical protein
MLEEAFPGYQAPIKANEMADYIFDFTLTGNKYYNGKVLQVSSTNLSNTPTYGIKVYRQRALNWLSEVFLL